MAFQPKNKKINYQSGTIHSVKLGAKTVKRFFSLADGNFVEDVKDDLRRFIARKKVDSVLVFPPVSNYRRFLIHNCVELLELSDLATFSIGVNDERRTVVCYREKLLSDEACAKPIMGLSQTEREDDTISNSVGGCKRALAQPAQEKIRSGPAKPRRPDRAVYVPRALRNADTNPEDKTETAKKTNQTIDKPSKSPSSKDKNSQGTPKKQTGTKNYFNVYTPPHLRNQRSHNQPTADDSNVPSVPNSDSAIKLGDNNYNLEVGENFYIGDYFTNGQLGFFAPNYFTNPDENWRSNESDVKMAVNGSQSNIIDDNYLYSKDSKDEDEKNELKRASQEINRSSKRIIKQSFHSDILVISDPIDEQKPEVIPDEPMTPDVVEDVKPKVKLEAKVSLKREDNDWDAVFDDSGECLDPTLLEELTATVGKVHISKTKNNYEQYQTKGQALFNGPIDETLAHVVEVYDFPSEFKTNDLLSVFSEYKDTGFEIKWVDDTHALIVFSSAKIAAEVLSSERPIVRCRPLHAATLESRNKAKKCAEFLQPYRQRPETCTALARRLVSGALGVKLSTARQERAEERRLITIAKEKKRQALLHKEAAWEGSLANTTDNT